MSSIHNVILVSAVLAQLICQGITVQPQENKVFLFLPQTTPLPPQLAYYVKSGKSNENLDKSASTHNGRVLSVNKPLYPERNRPEKVPQSKFGFVQNQQKYPKLQTSSNQPFGYRSNDPSVGSYNYHQYYGSVTPNRENIVRATPPPERRPGRTASLFFFIAFVSTKHFNFVSFWHFLN